MKRLVRNISFFFYGVLVSVVIATMINAAHAEMVCFDTSQGVDMATDGMTWSFDEWIPYTIGGSWTCTSFNCPSGSGETFAYFYSVPGEYVTYRMPVVECPESGGGEGEGAYYFPITPDDASLLTDAFMYGFFLVGACAIAGIAVGAIFRLIKG